MVFLIDIFLQLQFLNHFLKWCPILDSSAKYSQVFFGYLDFGQKSYLILYPSI